MADAANGSQRYQVHCSAAITEALREFQRQTPGITRKRVIASAFRQIIERLQRDPLACGEPLYRLPGLRLQIRTCSLVPLVVDFGVSEDRPLVFIKGVKLLPESGT